MGHYRKVEQFYFSKWPLYESFQYLGMFMSILIIYPFYILLFLTVEYQRSIRDIILYYMDTFLLWSDIQFLPLWTMIALGSNAVILLIPEFRFIGRRRHSLIARILRLTYMLFSVYVYALVFMLMDSTW